MKGTCVICGRPVESHETAAWRVTGWEVERSQGGANHIVQRERVAGTVVHSVCLESQQRRRKLRIPDDQESLL